MAEAERIILPAGQKIACPSCRHVFSLSEGLTREAMERLMRGEADWRAQREQELRGIALAQAQADVQAAHKQELARQAAKVAAAEKEKAALAERIKQAETAAVAAAKAEMEGEQQRLAAQLAAKESQIKSAREREMAMLKEQEALKAKQAELELEVQRQVAAQREQVAAEARAKEAERFALERAEMQRKIDAANEQAAAMQRRLTQGSQEAQGEALEQEIEEGLRRAFPADAVEPVKKGQRGADIVQRVRSRAGEAVGAILWETKRAENWSNAWIAKLKEDQQAAGADLAVLVSAAMPKEAADPYQEIDGVWVVQPRYVRPTAALLRKALLDQARARVLSEGREEKAGRLYAYLTGPAFGHRLRALAEAFSTMQSELAAEKNALTKIWNRRQKQIDLALENAIGFAGDMEGIAGEALPAFAAIAALPVPEE